MGFMVFLYTAFHIAVIVVALLLLARFVNAVEKIANVADNQERQVGRLATAVEQLWALYNKQGKPNEPSQEG